VNAEPKSPLFRKEVLERRVNHLHGDINVAVPISWQIIGYLLLGALAVTIIFLASANYARVEAVGGAVTLDTGVAQIIPSRPGTITAIATTEGARVRAGQPLVHIRSGEYVGGGETAPERMKQALARQDARLAKQSASLLDASEAEQAGLAAQIAGLRSGIVSLETQIEEQQRLVDVAEDDYQRAQSLAAKGYMSKRDLATRETELVSRRQQLAQLGQARSQKLSDLAAAQRAIAQSSANAAAQIASTGSNRAQLAQQLAEIESAQGYTLVSPVDGIATGITARIGQAAGQQPLMMVVPANAETRAELYVPSAAAGFLKVGQPVHLAVDAFPYQSFGTVDAQIKAISSAAIAKATDSGATVPVYLVTASIPHPWVMAFGKRQPLLPGMSLTARIVTRKQSLLEWLFEPLFAVRER